MNKAVPSAPAGRRSVVVKALIGGILIVVAAFAFQSFRSRSENPPLDAPPVSSPGETASQPVEAPAQTREAAARVESRPTESVPTLTRSPKPATNREGDRRDPKDLVNSLVALIGREAVTSEAARKWKESLQQLIRQGANSVPSIQQFLAQNRDANYAGVSGADALGYGSLRSAMLDALAQMGGPEATQAMLQTLQTSIFPSDIATLAQTLDAPGGGQFQPAILDAVRQQLNLGAADQLGGANVLPLFQVLANAAANGALVAGDLAQYARNWPYYSAIALAGLPDGTGVPGLAQLAQGAVPDSQTAAAQALAELAPQNPQALESLLELAKNGQLPDSVLAQTASWLAGRQYQLGPPPTSGDGANLTFHVGNGNQDFSAVEPPLTQAQITQSLAAINQLLQVVPTTDAATQDALQTQRNLLMAKQTH